jgi:glycosyltransferase involved in cell wall biosynthesis
MILKDRFPPDIRVEKEARALIAAGHKVHLLAYQSGDCNEPSEEQIDGILVHRILPECLQLQRVARWVNSLRFMLIFFDPYWAKQIERYVREFEIETLHVHDLPLVRTAVSVGRRLGIPVIADFHENYPAALETNDDPKGTLGAWLNSNPKRWASYERQAAGLANHVIVVVDEAKERLILAHGLSTNKITVVMNVEDIDHFQNLNFDPEILTRYHDSFLVSYVGGGGRNLRGLDTAIRAIATLRRTLPNLKLIIVGPSEDEIENLRPLAEAEGVNDSVEMISWQPFTKVPSYIHVSKICLVPHQQNSLTDTTIPHKLFQYMLMGKPVVASSCRPLRRIVEETGCGLVFRAGNPQDLAKKILTLYENSQFQIDCGRRGREAVLNRYNWKIEGRKLCLLYESLAKNFKG